MKIMFNLKGQNKFVQVIQVLLLQIKNIEFELGWGKNKIIWSSQNFNLSS